MATVDLPRGSKRSRRKYEAALDEPRKSHAFRNGMIVMFLLLSVGVYFAPLIVAKTPLKDTAIRAALDIDGTVSLGSLSLGWFSSIAADDVLIADNDGQEVLKIDHLRTAKTLIGLLLDLGNVGRIEINRLEVHAVCNQQDTNLEQVFAKLIEKEEAGARVAIEIKIADGTVHIDDVPGRRNFKIEKMQVDCAIADSAQPVVVTASGELADQKSESNFKLQLETKRSADGKNDLAGGKVDCQSTGLPLELIAPVLRRLMEGATIEGRLSTRLTGAWGDIAEGQEASVQGEALITKLALSATALGTDTIELERVEIPCHLVQRGEVIDVQKLGLVCDVGELHLSGTAPMSDLSAPDKLAALVRENYKLNGQLDLVRVAQLLPETLRIREGTEITSGKIQLNVTSRQQDGSASWAGEIDASHLGAKSDGRALVWENPLALNFSARETATGLLVERAECTSSFLHAKASGTAENFFASANFDLARLVAELKQFVDLSEMKLAGQGDAKITVKRGKNDQFTTEGQFQAKGFQFVPVAGGRAWQEDTVLARLDAVGQFAGASLKRLDRGTLTVDIGAERLSAKLAQGITDPATSDWPLECDWHGNLAHWVPRLEACLGLSGWEVRGTGKLHAVVTYSPKNVELELARADFQQLQVWGNQWFINEPSAVIAVAGLWDFAKQRAEISEAKFNAGSTAAVVRNAVLQAGEESWQVDGGAAEVGADLGTLYRWAHDPRKPYAWRVGGRLAATADLKYAANTATARINGTIDQLQMAEVLPAGANTVPSSWNEPRITLAAIGTYHPTSAQLKLEKAQIAANAVRCEAQGLVPLSPEGGDIDLNGTLEYDWQQLAPIWKPYLGSAVQIAGKQTRSFDLKGKLAGSPTNVDSWKQVAGNAAVGITGANFHGFLIGPTEVKANLADGIIRTAPIDAQVSQGRFTMSPVVRLTPGPSELFLARGPLLTDIRLSPEMCSRGMKFIAPIVAETTVAEGRFSVTMDGGRLPLSDPGAGDMSGHMAIHAQVKPGPVAQEFLALLNELVTILKQGNLQGAGQQSGALMAIDTDDVEFRLVNRRVYHRNLKFIVGTTPVVTHGSVGLDETLSMVAEIPIRANLLGRDLSAGTLEGQTLQIPLTGTLGKPKLDRGILKQFTSKLFENAARGVLVDEVNKQFERLFPLQK